MLIGGHYFHVSYFRRDRHFALSSEPGEGLALCRAKAISSFLSYFKTLQGVKKVSLQLVIWAYFNKPEFFLIGGIDNSSSVT